MLRVIPGDSVGAAVMGNGFYFIKEINKQNARRLQQEWTEFNLIATRGKKAKQSKSLPGKLLPLQRNSCSTQAQLAPRFFGALAPLLF